MKNIANTLGKVSFGLAILTIFLCINYFAKLIPFIHVSSFILFMPLYLCPIALVLAGFSLVKSKSIWAILGAVLNGLMFLGEIAFFIMGASLLR